ncbi:MAG TPA: DUF1223 domain-containing protein [Chitinophaga sp.]|uniref:DUF1223 domain-containing protein n=1 Tax=Chitinophaga sp. TaxID=1869181 RepID=UPI002BA94803|nr:DUF1223 domain-containing protein [Chitinophaga sp.]HVI45373.1 DUF1223 domain-containing protein [Chitinophaga sp.]
MKTMKTIFKSVAIVSLFIGTVAFLAPHSAGKVSVNRHGGKGFAVVELFTSEGCSSCPPADELISRLQQEDVDSQLYILAFHVDYWDHQGWKDRFSDHAWSQRQQQYAAWLRVRTIYTPQLIVNGEREQIGSDAGLVGAAINQALEQPVSRKLQLEADIKGQQLIVTSNLSPVPGTELLVALVQREAQSRVDAGENSGRKLAHVQIVRDLKTITGNDARFRLPRDFAPKNWELIGFVQDQRTGKITDAARVRW